MDFAGFGVEAPTLSEPLRARFADRSPFVHRRKPPATDWQPTAAAVMALGLGVAL